MQVTLQALAAGEKARLSLQIVERVQALPEWQAARHVALYFPLPSEPDLLPLLSAAGKTFYFPRITATGLEVAACSDVASLAPGPLGTKEPVGAAADPLIIDFALIPGLAFDGNGGRLGRGGGFYDRLLPVFSPQAFLTGVCFQCQKIAPLPLEPHDGLLHCLVTEEAVLRSAL